MAPVPPWSPRYDARGFVSVGCRGGMAIPGTCLLVRICFVATAISFCALGSCGDFQPRQILQLCLHLCPVTDAPLQHGQPPAPMGDGDSDRGWALLGAEPRS